MLETFKRLASTQAWRELCDVDLLLLIVQLHDDKYTKGLIV